MSDEKKYQIDFSTCKSNIHGVCPKCGGVIEPIETVDNSGNLTYWSGCRECGEFKGAVNPLYFAIARQIAKEGNRHFENETIDAWNETEKKIKRETQDICGILQRADYIKNEMLKQKSGG